MRIAPGTSAKQQAGPPKRDGRGAKGGRLWDSAANKRGCGNVKQATSTLTLVVRGL